jgi:hypothetical protein
MKKANPQDIFLIEENQEVYDVRKNLLRKP